MLRKIYSALIGMDQKTNKSRAERAIPPHRKMYNGVQHESSALAPIERIALSQFSITNNCFVHII